MAVTLTLLCIILQIIQVHAAEYFHGTALLNGETELRCKFQNNSQIIINYYWQRGNDVVNYWSTNEAEKKTIIDKRYQGRSSLNTEGVLTLYNVTFADRGKYTCHQMVRQGNDRKKSADCDFHLDVLANFSVPEISLGSSFEGLVNGTTVEVENGTAMSFHCSSGRGFPKPQEMTWTLSYREGSHKPPRMYEITNVSETYYISSNLSWRMEENVNITCELAAHHKAVSQTLHIVVKEKMETPPHSKRNEVIIIIICVILLVSFLPITIIMMVRKKKKTQDAKAGVSQRGSQGSHSEDGREGTNQINHQELALSATERYVPTPPEELKPMISDKAANGS